MDTRENESVAALDARLSSHPSVVLPICVACVILTVILFLAIRLSAADRTVASASPRPVLAQLPLPPVPPPAATGSSPHVAPSVTLDDIKSLPNKDDLKCVQDEVNGLRADLVELRKSITMVIEHLNKQSRQARQAAPPARRPAVRPMSSRVPVREAVLYETFDASGKRYLGPDAETVLAAAESGGQDSPNYRIVPVEDDAPAVATPQSPQVQATVPQVITIPPRAYSAAPSAVFQAAPMAQSGSCYSSSYAAQAPQAFLAPQFSTPQAFLSPQFSAPAYQMQQSYALAPSYGGFPGFNDRSFAFEESRQRRPLLQFGRTQSLNLSIGGGNLFRRRGDRAFSGVQSFGSPYSFGGTSFLGGGCPGGICYPN